MDSLACLLVENAGVNLVRNVMYARRPTSSTLECVKGENCALLLCERTQLPLPALQESLICVPFAAHPTYHDVNHSMVAHEHLDLIIRVPNWRVRWDRVLYTISL